MKVAVSSTGNGLESNVADVFGRCPYFIFVDTQNGQIKGFEAVENKMTAQPSGVGVSAAQMVAEKDISAVIAGAVGPRALEVFRQFDIQVYKASGSVKEAVQKFLEDLQNK